MVKIRVKVRVKILADIPGHKKGQMVIIETDKDGIPLERFWRRRFKDAKTDNCLEIIQSTPLKTLKKSKSKQHQKSEYSQEEVI